MQQVIVERAMSIATTCLSRAFTTVSATRGNKSGKRTMVTIQLFRRCGRSVLTYAGAMCAWRGEDGRADPEQVTV